MDVLGSRSVSGSAILKILNFLPAKSHLYVRNMFNRESYQYYTNLVSKIVCLVVCDLRHFQTNLT
jgi:hypothetical protein